MASKLLLHTALRSVVQLGTLSYTVGPQITVALQNIVALPRYPTNTHPTPKQYVQLLQ